MPFVNHCQTGGGDFSLGHFFGFYRQPSNLSSRRTQVKMAGLITLIVASIAGYSMSNCEKVTIKECLLPIVLVSCSSGIALFTFCLAVKAYSNSE